MPSAASLAALTANLPFRVRERELGAFARSSQLGAFATRPLVAGQVVFVERAAGKLALDLLAHC